MSSPSDSQPSSSSHNRTLTSLLSNDPGGSDPFLGPRSVSEPSEDHLSLRQPLISAALSDTHPHSSGGAGGLPRLLHALSEPMQQTQEQALSRDLKDFDPLATLSPPPMYAHTIAAGGETPAAAAAATAAHSNVTTSAPSASSTSVSASTAAANAAAVSLLHSQFNIGPDQTISSINSYSSATLSSGSFTAISVSPIVALTPGGHHVLATPNGISAISPPQLPASTSASPPEPAEKQRTQLDFYGATGAATAPVVVTTPASAASAAVHAERVRTMSVDISDPSSFTASSPASQTQQPQQPQQQQQASDHLSAVQPPSSLFVSSPSVAMPTIHPSPDSAGAALAAGVSASSTRSTTSGVTFEELDTHIDAAGRITQRRPSTASSSSASAGSGSGGFTADQTPTTLRIHHEDDHTPTFPSLESLGLNSPSFPQASSSPDLQGYFNDGSSPRRQGQGDSPLPPVVSALMAAQKAAGTTPGATLAMPMQSHLGRAIFIVGDASGAGKTSVAMGLLHLFLKRGYKPSELAYIKPCTQCEDVQLISKYCEKMGIQHQGIGPVIFYEGFTAEVIDGKAESVDVRRARIQKAVNKISEGKKWVLVDGVGYAAVGSVAGVSNAEVASLLNAPVLVVGRPGIGNAIDSMNFILAYFEKFHVKMVGACWNRLPPMHTYHSYEQCKHYVTKYFKQVRNGIISTYGHIPLVTIKSSAPASSSDDPTSTPAKPVELACRLRPAKKDLVLSPDEAAFVDEFLAVMEREFDIETLLGDLNRYYQAHRLQLVSVV